MKIDGARLWDSLMRMAQLGATERGGVNRQTLTDLDREARDLFISWCREAGCRIRIDPTGNIFARRPGRLGGHRAVLAGSHLDTQPAGGKFDGAYGVLAGLEVVRTLNDRDQVTERPIEVVAWTNEEGCRFAPSMMGSGVFAGQFDPGRVAATTDAEGRRFGAELERIGYRGTDRVSMDEVAAYFELHIEQGPVLEQTGKSIGVVTGAQGQRWFDLNVTGQEAHAGTTPMENRRDALLGAARIVEAVRRIGREHLPGACATVGQLDVHPNSRNTIPGRVGFSVDLRHPEEGRLSSMRSALKAEAAATCSAAGLHVSMEEIWHQSPLRFDPGCIDAVRRGAAAVGCGAMEIVSGAGHDACHIAERAPTAMIFIPCAGGISHNELEDATREDCAAGCNVL
ncbi:MAG: Zn-dependent hydrolase, partial [Spirochaetaceae bacterium]|nr:Zn-dependent hydrolase [Spirochaetaceae bacterium]